MCGSMADIQSPTAEIRRGKKKKEEERNRMKIYMVCPVTQGDHKSHFNEALRQDNANTSLTDQNFSYPS